MKKIADGQKIGIIIDPNNIEVDVIKHAIASMGPSLTMESPSHLFLHDKQFLAGFAFGFSVLLEALKLPAFIVDNPAMGTLCSNLLLRMAGYVEGATTAVGMGPVDLKKEADVMGARILNTIIPE